MYDALLLVATAIQRAHDRWCMLVGRRFTLSGRIAVLEDRVARLEAENRLLRSRFLRLPSRRRPHYRDHERRDILWHAARYGLSLEQTAAAFVVTVQTLVNWHRVLKRKDPPLVPPRRGPPARPRPQQMGALAQRLAAAPGARAAHAG